jgi:light-regulated signal transduction histidine kinase (bacteriophytochrome)
MGAVDSGNGEGDADGGQDRASVELAELLYAVSHDVRAPLRVIDGFSEALSEDYADALPADARQYLETIRSAVARMERSFEGIQQLSRVSQAPLRLIDVDVSAMAGMIVAELRATDATRDVRAEVQPGLTVKADPALFGLALGHLLQNAWKFTARRPDAAIAVGTEAASTLFVRDNGAGFEPASAQRMFGPFQRFHPASEFDGLGIGLALVRRVVHRHGGRVWAVGAPQRGTTVFIELP